MTLPLLTTEYEEAKPEIDAAVAGGKVLFMTAERPHVGLDDWRCFREFMQSAYDILKVRKVKRMHFLVTYETED